MVRRHPLFRDVPDHDGRRLDRVEYDECDRGWAFDKYPFPLLSIVLALEAVLLTSCVLMRQNAIDQTSERRNHLGLQINLLAEEEATKSLDLLQRIAERLDVPFEKDRKSIELANATPVDEIARDLRAREKLKEAKS